MLLIPPCHKLSHFLGPPPPSSVTYFMDGPYSVQKFRKRLHRPYKPIRHAIHMIHIIGHRVLGIECMLQGDEIANRGTYKRGCRPSHFKSVVI